METNILIIIAFAFITVYTIIISFSIKNCYRYIKVLHSVLLEKNNNIINRQIDFEDEIKKLRDTTSNSSNNTIKKINDVNKLFTKFISDCFAPFTVKYLQNTDAFKKVYNHNMQAYTKDMSLIIKTLNDNIDNVKAIADKVGVEENILKLDKAKLGFTENDIRNMIVSTLLDENFTTELKTAILSQIDTNCIAEKKNKATKKE